MNGINIKELREKKSLTQDQLAKLCGVSPAAVCKWESEKTKPCKSSVLLLQMVDSGVIK